MVRHSVLSARRVRTRSAAGVTTGECCATLDGSCNYQRFLPHDAMPATPSAPPKPRRRFQYSLRTLLLLFLLASVVLSWFTVRMQRATRQRAAVTTITSLGGMVVFDDEPEDMLAARTGSRVPRWLRQLLGDDFFHTAVRVVAFNDASMEAVPHLPALRRIDFVGSPATDAGLVHVRGLRRLQRLNLADTQITDAGLEHLTGLTQLRELCLRGTAVTAAGVQRLQEALPDCRMER